MRIGIVTLMAMFALTGCGSLMERYQSKVTEMKSEGVSKFGVNHGYDTSLRSYSRSEIFPVRRFILITLIVSVLPLGKALKAAEMRAL